MFFVIKLVKTIVGIFECVWPEKKSWEIRWPHIPQRYLVLGWFTKMFFLNIIYVTSFSSISYYSNSEINLKFNSRLSIHSVVRDW